MNSVDIFNQNELLTDVSRKTAFLYELRSYEKIVDEEVKKGNLIFPVEFDRLDPVSGKLLHLRIWKYPSIFEKYGHLGIKPNSVLLALQRSGNFPSLFWELYGEDLEQSWFKQFLMVCNYGEMENDGLNGICHLLHAIKLKVMKGAMPEIIQPSYDQSNLFQELRKAIRKAHLADNHFFFIEPLVVGGAIGEFVISAIVLAGLNLSAIQQITLDNECFAINKLPTIGEGDVFKTVDSVVLRVFQRANSQRTKIRINTSFLTKVQEFQKTLKELQGNQNLDLVEPTTDHNFKFRRYFPNSYRFLMQYSKQHLSISTLYSCFLILLFDFPTPINWRGAPYLITPKLLRWASSLGRNSSYEDALMDREQKSKEINGIIDNA